MSVSLIKAQRLAASIELAIQTLNDTISAGEAVGMEVDLRVIRLPFGGCSLAGEARIAPKRIEPPAEET